jgi:hypothetical protein
MPGQLQSIIDYGARTDGQPVYFGHAVLGTITSNTGWIIFYYTYDGSGNMLTKQTAYGAWTNRTALAYA